MKTLFERIGGDAAVNAAVDIFYKKVLNDDRTTQFFEGLDMAAQANKQKEFLTMVFGGPNNYSGKNMRDAHAHLGLKEFHFNAVVELLAETLKELNVPGEMIGEVAKIANSVKADVLNQ